MKKLALVLLVLLLAGCQDYRLSDQRVYLSLNLPEDSTEIKDAGKNWVTFKWKNQCFLFSEFGSGNTSTTALAKIDCPAQ